MTIDSDDKRELIRYRLEQANDTIEDVRILIENNRFRAAVNRIYSGSVLSCLEFPANTYRYPLAHNTLRKIMRKSSLRICFYLCRNILC